MQHDATLFEGQAVFARDQQCDRAALFLAQGELTDTEIARECKVNRTTLWRWRQQSAFKAKVAEHVKELGDVARRYALGRLERRLRNLSDRHERMQQIILDRAAAPDMQDVPGGSTGLLVRQTKVIGAGKNFQVVHEYVFDVGLLRQLLEYEKQAAIECGQWGVKPKPAVPQGPPEPIRIIEFVRPEPAATIETDGQPSAQ